MDIDTCAMDIIQQVGGCKTRRPAYIPGDGNCFFSSVAVAAYGDMKQSTMLRVRIFIELALNHKLYKEHHVRNKLDLVSQDYEPSLKATATLGAHAGGWQLQAASSVIDRPIKSVYPPVNGLCDDTARILTMTVNPLAGSGQEDPTIFIMWTHTRGMDFTRTWLPNRFVPLVECPQENGTVIKPQLIHGFLEGKYNYSS
jgi:hypothetical protein